VPGLKTDYIPQNVPPSEVAAEAWVKDPTQRIPA
jgi:cytochrome c oxidase subunit I